MVDADPHCLCGKAARRPDAPVGGQREAIRGDALALARAASERRSRPAAAARRGPSGLVVEFAGEPRHPEGDVVADRPDLIDGALLGVLAVFEVPVAGWLGMYGQASAQPMATTTAASRTLGRL